VPGYRPVDGAGVTASVRNARGPGFIITYPWTRPLTLTSPVGEEYAERSFAKVRPVTDPVVMTDLGLVRGVASEGVYSFRGIPFASAPEGPLRFRLPAPPARWDGVRDGAAFGCAPPQPAPAPGVPPFWQPGDGLDCLTLNVWSPDPGPARLPVMVWIYGGLWKFGSSSMPQYDAGRLARSGVVVVTVNYRVGFEGFGHLPGVPENRGLHDQIAALQWVQRNIESFGGDAAAVTVFGQSAGAASIALLTAAPATQGLFRRAIAQSVPDSCRSTAEAARITDVLAHAAGVAATWEGFAGLLPETVLAVQDAPLTGAYPGFSAFGPVIDGDLVTGPPWSALRAGARRDVDLICGFTHDEYRGMAPVPAQTDLEEVATALGLGAGAAAAYRAARPGRADADAFAEMMSDALVRMPATWVAEAHAQAGGRTWLYDLTWPAPAVGAGHGVDVPLVFGNPGTRYAARLLGTPPPEGFAGLSREIRSAWTSFAASGDPGWPRFDAGQRRTRLWDTPPTNAAYPLAGLYRPWPQDTAR
jgi:carboxylesterase type B